MKVRSAREKPTTPLLRVVVDREQRMVLEDIARAMMLPPSGRRACTDDSSAG